MKSGTIANLVEMAESAEAKGLFHAAIVHYEKLERMLKHDYHDAERSERYRQRAEQCKLRAD